MGFGGLWRAEIQLDYGKNGVLYDYEKSTCPQDVERTITMDGRGISLRRESTFIAAERYGPREILLSDCF